MVAAEPAHWQMYLLQLDEGESDPLYARTGLMDDYPIGIITFGGHGRRVNQPLARAYFQEIPAVDSGLSVSMLD